MIKVQPARSRMLKSESSERILLTMPRRGFVGVGGAYALGALLWLAFVTFLFIGTLRRGDRGFGGVVAGLGLPGGLGMMAGVGHRPQARAPGGGSLPPAF